MQLVGNTVSGDISYGMDLLNDVTSQPLIEGRSWVPEMKMNSVVPFAQLKLKFFEDLVVKGGFRTEAVSIAVDNYNTLPSVNAQTGEIVYASFAITAGELTYL